MIRFFTNWLISICGHFHSERYFKSLIFFYIMIGVPAAAISQSVDTWKLVKKEYPVLPAVIMEITEGRNAGSFIKIRRTQMNNEVVYTAKSVERGTTLCTWISAFIWDDNFPEIINSGKEYNIDMEARFDRREGESCGMGRIGVTYGSREEPLRDRAAHVVRVKGGLADPDPGGIAPPIATETFQVVIRPDLPNVTMFTVAIHISDGGVTDQVVALYVYEKVGTQPAENTNTPPVRNNASGTIVTLQSLNYPDLFICHRNYLGELAAINNQLDRQNASFRIVPGLANGELVSFESVNFPGYYLRHEGFRIKLAPFEDNDLFKNDATFKRVQGLANSSMVSFESSNFPGYYIRHYDYHLFLQTGNTDLFRQDATFKFASFGH